MVDNITHLQLAIPLVFEHFKVISGIQNNQSVQSMEVDARLE